MTLVEIQDRLWCSLSLAHAVKKLLPEPITGQRLSELLSRHGIVDAQAIDDPEGYDNYRTLEAINTVAKELSGPPPAN